MVTMTHMLTYHETDGFFSQSSPKSRERKARGSSCRIRFLWLWTSCILLPLVACVNISTPDKLCHAH